jgi:hypothetical protein
LKRKAGCEVVDNPTAGVDRSDDYTYQGEYTYKVKGKEYKYFPSD